MLHQVMVFYLRIGESRAWVLGGHFPSYAPASWHRCVFINFSLRIDNFRAGAWYSCFPINFSSRIDVLRAWDIELAFSRIWISLSIRYCTKHFAPLPNTRFTVSWAVVDVDLDMTCLLFSVIDFVLLSAGGSGWECS